MNYMKINLPTFKKLANECWVAMPLLRLVGWNLTLAAFRISLQISSYFGISFKGALVGKKKNRSKIG